MANSASLPATRCKANGVKAAYCPVGNRLEGIRAGSGVITGADQVHSVGVGNKAAGDLGVLVNSQVLAVEILVSGGSAGTTDLNSLDSAVSLSAELEHIVVQDLSAGLVGTGV